MPYKCYGGSYATNLKLLYTAYGQTCKCTGHLQNLGARNKNNIHITLFPNAVAAPYTMESELHGSNLKMLPIKMQRNKTIKIIDRQLWVPRQCNTLDSCRSAYRYVKCGQIPLPNLEGG
jgi:hypothetical protein